MTFSPALAIPLFFVMLILLEAGRRLRARPGRHKLDGPGFPAIEGAVFGLFGLLLAFTFSGAIGRYDTHRNLILEEGNDIGTAYLRLDLLPATAQPGLRQLFRDYTLVRAHRFDMLPDNPKAIAAAAETARLQSEIWKDSLAAATAPGASPDAAKLLLPALNSMFDITSSRKNAFDMHPPPVVYFLLFALSCACALLAGYGMTGQRRSLVHLIGFAFAVAFTIYATLEIEYPRRGLIRLTHNNQILLDVHDSMK